MHSCACSQVTAPAAKRIKTEEAPVLATLGAQPLPAYVAAAESSGLKLEEEDVEWEDLGGDASQGGGASSAAAAAAEDDFEWEDA